MQDLIVFKVDKARALLAEAKCASQAKQVVDLAHAAKIYAKRHKLSEEAIKYAHGVEIEALARLGEFIKASPKANGTRGNISQINAVLSGGVKITPPVENITLDELGIDKNAAKEARVALSLFETALDLFNLVVENELSLTQAKRELVKRTAPEPPAFPTGKYRVIYADPPWKYGNTQPDYQTEQADYYLLMPIEGICEMPIKELAEDNAVLFLWVTSPILEEAFQVIKAWGFKYKASFVWDKIKHNMGHYNSVRHEFLLVCTRGSCQPDVQKLFDSVVSVESGKHSEKPEVFRQMIDTLYPNGRRIELFARKDVEGWTQYGNELKSEPIP